VYENNLRTSGLIIGLVISLLSVSYGRAGYAQGRYTLEINIKKHIRNEIHI